MLAIGNQSKNPCRFMIIGGLCLAAGLPLARPAAAQTPLAGSIHGNVGYFPPSESFVVAVHGSSIAPGRVIFLPDITVVARNASTHLDSAPALTNSQGYFRTPDLPAGQYQICVSKTGFAANCFDRNIEVSRPVVTVGQIIPIRPAGNVIIGAATLADHVTPCFFFRPSFSPVALTAKASLLGADGKPQAGPVNGNSAGQYVLPTPPNAAGTTLRVTCDANGTDAPVALRQGVTAQSIALSAGVPRILGFDFTKAGVGIRRADPGDTVAVSVLAEDPDGNALHYSWADSNGRLPTLPDAPSIQWPLPNANTLNTLIVYVSNGKGGIATYSRTLQSGPNENFFSGRVFNRQTNVGVAGASVTINGVAATADAGGNFHLVTPDAAKFVVNATKPGFALASLVLTNHVVGIQIPLDQVQTSSVNGATGGTIGVGPGSGCNCRCNGGRDDDRFHVLVDTPDTHIDIRHDGKDGGKAGGSCGPANGDNTLSVVFQPGSFANAAGAAYAGTVSVEAFRYDLSQPNPIPGDFGGVFQGKTVRLGSFGAFHLLPRDDQGQPLAMAAGKRASISVPIQTAQLGAAPATIPLFHYDEASGQWLEDGTLTRTGNAYVGEISHFSVFNADTVFPGGACVKVVLSGFTMPVTLDAVYFDPSVGTFHHNGFTTSDTIVGVERMTPNQSFTLTIVDSGTPTPTTLSVPLFSGPGLDPMAFPSGFDTDTVNFKDCNGPVQVSNNTLPATPPYFLGPVFGGTIVDNSAIYQAATGANAGGSRETLNKWKAVNGFQTNGTLAAGEATATYFNNGDLKFGRDMHCRVTNNTPGAIACYVSNFGVVGTDDAAAALAQAESYEASGQVAPLPGATVTMEYDPTSPASAVQFWAYKGDGTYLAQPTLDSQGPKPIPDICMSCHQGTYSGTAGAKVNGAAFLAFDMDSFLDDTATPFPSSAKVTPTVQQQFHLLNNMVAATATPFPAITQLENLWYSNSTPTTPFTFNQGAAQLPGAPFLVQPGNIHHEPLYDSVVKIVCRTCHVAQSGAEWNAFSQMSGAASFIQSLACAPTVTMPHAEVPWKRFWQQSLSSTLDSELLFPTPGCPPN